MAEIVYLLCAVMSIVCAGLLIRSWLRTRSRLLLWSTLCFVGLAVNNLLLVVDLLVVHDLDLSGLRQAAGVTAIALLVFGQVWESK
jgi:hypothetical protein